MIAPTQTAQDQGVVRSDFVNAENGADGYSYTVRRFGFDTGLTIKARKGYQRGDIIELPER